MEITFVAVQRERERREGRSGFLIMRGRLPVDMLLPFSQGPLLQSFPYVRADTSGHIYGTGVLAMHTPSAATLPRRMKDCHERLLELLANATGQPQKVKINK